MAHRIVSRSEWGSRSTGTPTYVEPSRRKYFTLHYDGDVPLTKTGPTVPRGIQAFHMNTRGWRDIGYNFVIDQAGNIYEGRGWDVLGAHASAAGNAVGIGVQVHIGGDQKPSQAALNALDWLWDQCSLRFGRRLPLAGHRDFIPTSCPGTPLYNIVKSGRIPTTGTVSPAPATPATPVIPTKKEEFDMDPNEFKKLVKAAIVESLRDPEIAGDYARAALGGKYGIDASGDGEPDSAGNLIASIWTALEEIRKSVEDLKKPIDEGQL